MIDFKKLYNQQNLLSYLNEYLPDFEPQKEELQLNKKCKYIKSVVQLGKSKKLDLNVYEIDHISENDPRVTLSKEAFSILREYIARKSLVVFKNESTQNYRLSLITFQSTWESGNKVKTEFSNPRRYSFFLGPDAKVKTPTRFLLEKGKIIDFEDLKKRFSLEVVNKEFYKDISEQFIKLVGGSLNKGKKKIDYSSLLKLPSISNKSQITVEFAVRLIGRVIFCWFLREKKSLNRKSLMPRELLSDKAIGENADYYHKILEPIFFEILNRKTRRDEFVSDLFSSIPYLNGGLFSPQDDDFYRRNSGDFQSQYHNTLIIPDQWFAEFFEVLETYNFTIDENTSFDEELSIDPEMLGRIFENLLAEINPETGESARKSTGSYYTPRVIVDYMVDESLLLYLKEQTRIEEKKLRAIISYDLDDDADNPATDSEKQKIVDALEKVKILDPACGSGAFPIGALQKIVFILQQIDPNGKLWREKQLAKADPEFRKDIEKRFSNKEYDFIRKLGIIRDCIYGIDIQPIATEISRLRCFLTLIVDEQVDDIAENRGIKPLPNLDFKFVTANSLIGLPKIDEPQGSMFDDYQKINELKKIRDEYFNASGIEREQLKTQFVSQQKLLFKDLQKEHGWQGVSKAELTNKLTDWDPFTHKSTPWFDPEWMFGIKEGFDIVIANPPYIRSRNLKQEDRIFFSKNYRSAFRTFDIYLFFIEKSLEILNSSGRLSFIIPYPFLTQPYASKMRKIILDENTIDEIADLSTTKIFESAEVKNCLIFLKKGDCAHNTLWISNINQMSIAKTLTLKQNSFLENPECMFKLEYIGSAKTLVQKIEQNSIELKKIMYISKGIEVYQRDSGKTKKEFIHKNSNGVYKPYLEAKEISRYCLNWSGKFIDYQPSKHCSPKFPELFENKKIIVKRIIGKRGLSSVLDTDSYYVENTLICCLPKYELEKVLNFSMEELNLSKSYDILLVLAILNSKLMNFYFKTKLGDNLQIYNSALESLPIRKISTGEQKSIIEIVDKILIITRFSDYFENLKKQTQVKEYEKQIDQMVYELYGLTKEEIEIVENSSKK